LNYLVVATKQRAVALGLKAWDAIRMRTSRAHPLRAAHATGFQSKASNVDCYGDAIGGEAGAHVRDEPFDLIAGNLKFLVAWIH